MCMNKMQGIEMIPYYEEKKHTDTMFAFNIYPCTIPLDFSFVPLHWQDSMEVIYIKKGIRDGIKIKLDEYKSIYGNDDDFSDYNNELSKHLVLVDARYGLRPIDIQKAMKILIDEVPA